MSSLHRLLTAEELADILGLSTWTIYDLARQGLPHVRLGRAVRFEEARIREWLDAGGTIHNTGDDAA